MRIIRDILKSLTPLSVRLLAAALAWGNEHGQGKVVMHFMSPPHVKMECYFSGADVASRGRLPMNEWIQIVHTYQQGDSRIYVKGELSNTTKTPNAPLAIKTPARIYLGGWFNNYDFVGDIDEVRISKVTRSAEWVKLQHENQKAMPTLVGLVVKAGNVFAVSPATATVEEGESVFFTAQAGGAQKLYWILQSDGQEKIVAVDRFAFTFEAGRVTGDRAEFAGMIQPAIERDHYGKAPAGPITAPNLRRATAAAKDTIALEFDQPVVWADSLVSQFYLDGEKDKVASGSVSGNVVTLNFKEPTAATKVTYLKEVAWNQDNLLNGANGLAALTFGNVPLETGTAPR